MAHVREYPHESSCGRPSSRTNFSFRDRTFVRWIQWFSWFRAVVRLVLSIQLDLPAFFFFASRFGLRWCSVDQRLDFGEWHAGWLFEPVAAVDGHRFSSNLQWTWFCVCGLEDQRTNSSSSMSPSSWESSRTKEKCEKPPSQPNKKPPKKLTPNNANYEARPGCRTDWSELHTQPAARANDMINSPIEQKLQFSVCKTTRRFAGPSLLSCGLKPGFTKICIRISFCKTSPMKLLIFVHN